MKDLYIIGAGGFGRDVAWLVERINAKEKIWNLKGFLDDNKELAGNIEDGYPVIGDCSLLSLLDHEVWAVCAIGCAKTRKKIIHTVNAYQNVRYATLIDPSVICSNRVKIGEGSIICAATILTVNINIGRHVIINVDCTIGHDDVIHDYTTIYPSANISGNVTVGECAELGTGMQIIQGKCIGENTIIGAGTVVVKDIPENCTAVGCPAKIIKHT